MKILFEWARNLKLWMESFADKPNAMYWLFLLSFAESSFFPIPPDILLIAIAVTFPKKALQAAFWCTLGSVLGGIAGYYLGYYFMPTLGMPILEFYGKPEAMEIFASKYDEYGQGMLLLAAFTPIPFKLFTLASGATNYANPEVMQIGVFTITSAIGRAARFFLVAGIIRIWGPPMKPWIDKNFEKLTIAFTLLLIGGFVIYKYLLH
ncbi:VTT domain-containing protein [Candidatus Kapabacteria bacterium]|nr:VTT domain-containing protein [Candidatus Kapabacteria bacterium]